MTVDVIVIFDKPLTLELWKKLEEEFKAIHDQTFKQEVYKTKQPDGTWKGTIKEMRHGFVMYGTTKRKKWVSGKCPKCNKEVGKPLWTGPPTFRCSNCNTQFTVVAPTRAPLHVATATWIDDDEPDLKQIEIPCHWSLDHMVQTKKDIEAVLKKLGVTAKEIGMSY